MASREEKLRKVIDLGFGISQIKDIDLLLENILREARGFTNCDAGSINVLISLLLCCPLLFQLPISGYSALPSASAKSRNFCIITSNFAGFRDCAPSDDACSGSGCTSTINPSAPAATAA